MGELTDENDRILAWRGWKILKLGNLWMRMKEFLPRGAEVSKIEKATNEIGKSST